MALKPFNQTFSPMSFGSRINLTMPTNINFNKPIRLMTSDGGTQQIIPTAQVTASKPLPDKTAWGIAAFIVVVGGYMLFFAKD